MANRVILGAFDGTHVLRVSKPGYNVLDPNLPASALSFDSRWAEIAGVFMEGTVLLNNSVRSATVYHNLGYRPLVFALRRPGADVQEGAWFSAYTPEAMTYEDRVVFNNTPLIGLDGEQIYFDDAYIRYCILRAAVDG